MYVLILDIDHIRTYLVSLGHKISTYIAYLHLPEFYLQIMVWIFHAKYYFLKNFLN